MEQSRRQQKETEQMGIVIEHTERGREQAGMSREGRRTMEKVLENTVRDRLFNTYEIISKDNNKAINRYTQVAIPYLAHQAYVILEYKKKASKCGMDAGSLLTTKDVHYEGFRKADGALLPKFRRHPGYRTHFP